MRTRIATLLLVTAAVLPVTSCGGGDDLSVAVVDDVRGAAIDAAPTPQSSAQPSVQSDTGPAAPAAMPEPAPVAEVPVEEIAVAELPVEPQPAAGSVTATATATVRIGAPPVQSTEAAPVPDDLPLGDVPESDDRPIAEPVVEPAEESGAGAAAAATEAGADDAATDSDPDADDEWRPAPVEPPKLVDGVWHTDFDYLGSFDAGVEALPVDSPLAQHTALPEKPAAPAGDDDGDGEGAEPAAEPVIGIPDAVTAMDGQKVRIEGYMIPLKFEEGQVKTFFLSRYMMGCCFGVMPKASEVVEVTMVEGAKAFYDAYMPFVVIGTLEVVPDGTDPEFLQSVFRMQADSADYSEDW